MRKVHGVNLSPFVRKVRVGLAEKGLEYEVNPLMPLGGNPEVKALNPIGKIPILEEDDGYKLADSSVILGYLERAYPDTPLYPSDPKQLGEALFLEEYADTKLLEATLGFFVQNVVSKFIGQEPDAAVIEATREAQPEIFGYLETRAPESGEGIVGGRFGVADIAIASPMINMGHGGGSVDASRFPKLAAYVDRLKQRPSLKALIEEEAAGIPG